MTGVAVRYVRNRFGEEGVARMLALAGDSRPASVLEEPQSWTSYRHMIRLFEAAAEITGEPMVARRIGAEMLQQYEGTEVAELLRSLGSPGELVRNIATTGAKFSTVSRYEALAIGEGSAVITATGDAEHGRHPVMCEFTKGLLSQASVLFGLAPATVHESTCQARGGARCSYEVAWGTEALDDAERVTQLEAQVARMTRQLDSLFSTATDLLAADDVETVLGRIAKRAGSAVRAPRYVLAVRMGDDARPAVSHAGFDDGEAQAVAEELLAADPAPEAGRLVVDVTSSRRRYGRLAALFPSGQRFFPQERQLLEIYAKYAAAVLDMATALEDAKRRDRTARALLKLAARLATVGTRADVAARLADAIPEIIGVPQSAVFFWDAHARVLRAAAHVGFAEETAALLDDLTIHESDTPFLGEMLERPAPLYLDGAHTDEYMSALMAAVGVPATVVVPLVAHGDFHGVLSTPIGAVDEDLVERLEGLAAHGATALANAALVERLTEQATIDELTGLLNRRELTARFDEMVATAARQRRPVALLFIDLDDFKLVNDSLGHHAGDDLLARLSGRLSEAVRPGDVVGRLGGDEFAVLLPDTAGADAQTVAGRLLAVLGAPLVIDGHELAMQASIGVVVADGSTSADELLRHADLAMYAAKAAGGGGVSGVAAAAIRHRPQADAAVQLRRAIEHGELVLHYQPILELATGDIAAFEALVRWQHPDGRLAPPSEFLPVAERAGISERLDAWVIDRACRDAARWNQINPARPPAVSVNLSSSSVGDPGLIDRVAGVLAVTGLDPHLLILELTEHEEVRDVVRAEAVLRGLGDLGVRAALDDFGTAYSSLVYLAALPVDFLKLDRFLIERAARSPAAMRLVAGAISMAHRVDVKVVVEGIEEPDQLASVRELGADYAQGFLLGRAMPLDAAVTLLGGIREPQPS